MARSCSGSVVACANEAVRHVSPLARRFRWAGCVPGFRCGSRRRPRSIRRCSTPTWPRASSPPALTIARAAATRDAADSLLARVALAQARAGDAAAAIRTAGEISNDETRSQALSQIRDRAAGRPGRRRAGRFRQPDRLAGDDRRADDVGRRRRAGVRSRRSRAACGSRPTACSPRLSKEDLTGNWRR